MEGSDGKQKGSKVRKGGFMGLLKRSVCLLKGSESSCRGVRASTDIDTEQSFISYWGRNPKRVTQGFQNMLIK